MIPASAFGIVANATDQTTGLLAALASGESIEFPKGIIGYAGGALAFPHCGVHWTGQGITNLNDAPGRGTTFKKLSTGTGFMFLNDSTGLPKEGIELSNFCMDGNNLGDPLIYSNAHRFNMRRVVMHNQGGSDYALVLSGVNTIDFDGILFTGNCYGAIKIEKLPSKGYGANYGNFRSIRVLSDTTADAIRISYGTSLSWRDTFVESTIRIVDAVHDVHFDGLRSEIHDKPLLNVDGSVSQIHSVYVTGGRVNALANGTVPFFKLKQGNQVHIRNFHFEDGLSTAGRPYITAEDMRGASITSCSVRNTSGNAHRYASRDNSDIRIEAPHVINGVING